MQTEMENEAFSELTPIQRFFFGRSVFITGATGFVGKVLVEKLLRCCPGIGMLYLLMRPKRNKTAEERLDKLFKSELFSKLKEVYPHFRRKVRLIDGDLLKERLGISDEHFDEIKANVSVVFHSAARVQFNDPIKVAVQHNIIGTKVFVDMCHEMPHLEAVVHVSTAYVRKEADNYVLEEIPKTKVTPAQILNAMEWMDPGCQQAVEDYLLEKKLTTYLVTKALGEVVVSQECRDLPTSIIRPCNISPTFKDPFPGWCDSIQGISGLMLAGAKGVLRTLMSVPDLKLNVVPVDLVVNCMIVSAWHVAKQRPSSVYVVNCVMDYEKLPLADEAILKKALEKRSEYPLVNMFRYPDFCVYYNWIPYKIHSFFDEWIPAYFCDFFLYLFTGKTILVRVYKKINFIYDIFLRLGRDPWICRIENFNAMKKSLTDGDEEVFFMDTENFDWDAYMEDCFLGGRKFLAHEQPSNIPYAKKKAQIWWIVTTVLKWCIILFLLYYIFPRSLFGSSSSDERIYDIHS
ncbi:putative fatty acyl-CoA reductase CG5065 [Nephila pilipes]|uniref:Fatty acyl-CoA reductase n=1 Tax=Nephila pilipes TaxID=299642 RepID=A0A8X6QRI7_NEPPI|nr:putative fatty acyl-CoA reductase CG5065 [Nephila pilipes]